MTTWSALTTLAGAAPAEALGTAMERLDPAPSGVGVFEVEDGSGLWEVQAFFEAMPDRAGLALLEAVHGAAPFAVSEVPQTDWVAKVRRELAPVEAGRFFIHGAHDADRVPRGRVALTIEAAMAFGTGHHGTTQGCLLALDRLAGDGIVPRRVADIGCGTAVLAMAASRAWPKAEVVAADIDAVAVETAAANVAANGLAGQVTCVQAAGFGHPALVGSFDLILANILMAPLVTLASDMAGAAAPGARLILSGILADQADAVRDAYAVAGPTEFARERIGDWVTLILAR